MRVVRLPNLDAWTSHVAERFVAMLTTCPTARLCLATGNTPVPVYRQVAEAVQAGRCSFSKAEVFLLDEFGGVPCDAEGRCDVMLRRALLDDVDLPKSRYHPIDTDSARLDAACQKYDAAIGESLDLTILGIGANGHIGMNEPGSAPDSPTRRVELAPETMRSAAGYFGGQHAPTWGVTVGFAPLLRSREIFLLATGIAKQAIVERLLTEPASPALPASLLHQHPNCTLFVDAAVIPTTVPAAVSHRPQGSCKGTISSSKTIG